MRWRIDSKASGRAGCAPCSPRPSRALPRGLLRTSSFAASRTAPAPSGTAVGAGGAAVRVARQTRLRGGAQPGAVVRPEWGPEVDLTVSGEDSLQFLGRGTRGVGRRQGRRVRWYSGVAHEPLDPGRGADHEHPRGVAVHPEGVWHAERNHGRRTALELEALLARL